MNQVTATGPPRTRPRLLPIGGSILAVVVWASIAGQAPRPLLAEQAMVVDSDGDGLPDAQEQVLATDPLEADTDGDGFSDCEEVAHQTDPLSPTSSPEMTSVPKIGMSARWERGRVRIFIAVHVSKAIAQSTAIRFGLLAGRELGQLNSDYVKSISSIEQLDAPNGGLIQTYDVILPKGLLSEDSPLTFFAALAREGKTRYFAADKADLTMRDGYAFLRRALPGDSNPTSSAVGGGTTIHMPLPGSGDGTVPLDWNGGQVCAQTSQSVGSSGGVAVREIINAECIEAWATYCEPDCSASTGSRYSTVDLGVLLGG